MGVSFYQNLVAKSMLHFTFLACNKSMHAKCSELEVENTVGKVEYVVTKGVRKGWVGVKPPLELDILQKLYYLLKGD